MAQSHPHLLNSPELNCSCWTPLAPKWCHSSLETPALPHGGLTWARWKLAALEWSCCTPLAPLLPWRSTHTCAVVAALRKSLVTVVTCRVLRRRCDSQGVSTGGQVEASAGKCILHQAAYSSSSPDQRHLPPVSATVQTVPTGEVPGPACALILNLDAMEVPGSLLTLQAEWRWKSGKSVCGLFLQPTWHEVAKQRPPPLSLDAMEVLGSYPTLQADRSM